MAYGVADMSLIRTRKIPSPRPAHRDIESDKLRRSLPRALFEKRPSIFLRKFIIALVIIGAGYVAIMLASPWYAKVAAALVVGAMYAHLLVLQHETLHEHVFNSRRLNRIFGTVCGAFMLSSYTHYKFSHLRHHSSLGKPGNKEFFNDYNAFLLDTIRGMTHAAWHLGRYLEVARNIAWSLRGKPILADAHVRDNRRTAQEYRLFALMCAGAVVVTLFTGSLLCVYAWVFPTLLVAEPVYFLIELPEHFGLNTQNNPNVFENTRSIRAGRFASWFTDFNNFHAAHHFHQGVPIANVDRLDAVISDRYRAQESSYWAFYSKVLRGELR